MKYPEFHYKSHEEDDLLQKYSQKVQELVKKRDDEAKPKEEENKKDTKKKDAKKAEKKAAPAAKGGKGVVATEPEKKVT